MSLVTSALQIGKSALLAYQGALQVVGNNISNAGSPSYTRQTPILTPAPGVVLPGGIMPGSGITLSSLHRNVDTSLENRIRLALGEQADSLTQQQTLGRIEGILNELSDVDLSTLMQNFFNAFSQLQNQPHNIATRSMVLTAGDSLAAELSRQRAALLEMRDGLNRDLETSATQANKLVTGITALNLRITELESAAPGGANALRDERDALLRQLAEFVQIEVREQSSGGFNVYVGNEQLIQGGYSRGITTTLELNDGQPEVVVRFADNNGRIPLLGGKMAGLVAARDTHVMGQVGALNGLATALIGEVNKVHAQGQGLAGYTELTSSNEVLDAAAALNSKNAGLALTPRNGSFLLTVTELSSGAPIVSTIQVDLDGAGTDETLTTLAAQINAKASNVTATVLADNRLQITANAGFDFTFSEDSSNVLAALGMNTFFTGKDAQDIAVNSVLEANPGLLGAAKSPVPGDGSNAAAISALGSNPIPGLNGQSLTQYYNAIAINVATRSAAASAGLKAADAIAMSLNSQRESISGVSLDEETISLLRLERAFQGAARYSSVVDRLIDEMLGLVR